MTDDVNYQDWVDMLKLAADECGITPQIMIHARYDHDLPRNDDYAMRFLVENCAVPNERAQTFTEMLQALLQIATSSVHACAKIGICKELMDVGSSDMKDKLHCIMVNSLLRMQAGLQHMLQFIQRMLNILNGRVERA
jgi:hypothetical protein